MSVSSTLRFRAVEMCVVTITRATGAVTPLGPKYLGGSVSGPHTLVLFESDNDCASVVEDTHTSRLLRLPPSGCQVLGAESPSGKRVLSFDEVDGKVPGLMDRVTGKYDPRPAVLLRAAGVQSAQGVLRDDEHLLFSAVRVSRITGPQDPEALVLTCAVPRSGKPTCTVSRDFGPVVADRSTPDVPPRPEAYVVRSASTP